MRLALATRRDLPAWEIDDRPLHAALAKRGASVEIPIWDDPCVDWTAFDGVLVRTTWDYQEKLPAFRDWARRVARLAPLHNPVGVVEWNTHKRYLHDLERDGVKIAPTRWLARGSTVDVAETVRAEGWAEGFLKPCVGATARETLRFRADADGLAAAQRHVDRLLPDEDLMLQPFLRNVLQRGEWSAIFVDGRISHCVRKIPVPGDYRVQDDFGARDEPYRPTSDELAAAVEAMASATRRRGACPAADGEPLLYGRADFLWDDEGGCVVTELELVEPSLFFRHSPSAADLLADAWLRRLAR
ncbi:MAG: hypothetical protein JNK78_13655 [Planctomycetes bacterium]|nr:hypothetical protein [Planctomycetota bacterium]